MLLVLEIVRIPFHFIRSFYPFPFCRFSRIEASFECINLILIQFACSLIWPLAMDNQTNQSAMCCVEFGALNGSTTCKTNKRNQFQLLLLFFGRFYFYANSSISYLLIFIFIFSVSFFYIYIYIFILYYRLSNRPWTQPKRHAQCKTIMNNSR